MKLLPYRKLILHTHLTPDQCIEKMEQSTTPWSLDHLFKHGPKGKPFVGRVHIRAFDVRHLISYNNSFIPIAHGTLHPIDKGTAVSVIFKPHKVAMIFGCVLLAVFIVLIVVTFTAAILQDEFDKALLVLPVMLVVVTTVVGVSIKSEYENSKALLMQILKSPEPPF